jgi:hypothetical protein
MHQWFLHRLQDYKIPKNRVKDKTWIKHVRGAKRRESRIGGEEGRGRRIFSLNSAGGFAKRDQASVLEGVKAQKYSLGC